MNAAETIRVAMDNGQFTILMLGIGGIIGALIGLAGRQ